MIYDQDYNPNIDRLAREAAHYLRRHDLYTRYTTRTWLALYAALAVILICTAGITYTLTVGP